MSQLKRGDKVRILTTLPDAMKKRGFTDGCINELRVWVGLVKTVCLIAPMEGYQYAQIDGRWVPVECLRREKLP